MLRMPASPRAPERTLRTRPPGLVLPHHFTARTALTVDQPAAEAILLQHLVTRHDELKVPRRVRRLEVLVQAAAAGRVREADALRAVEQEDGRHAAEVAVVERPSS